MSVSTWPTWAWRLVLLCAVAQFLFMGLEMFLWKDIAAPKVAGYDETTAIKTVRLGMNMGLYNGLVAAGLIWSLWAPPEFGLRLALYLAIFMLVAGVFGALTVKAGILGQGVLGLLAAIALLKGW